MKLEDLEVSLERKYWGDPIDDETFKHIVEDVKLIHPGLDKVYVDVSCSSNMLNRISLAVTFKTPEDEMWYNLRWL